MSANDLKLLHVYPQRTPHDEAVIAGNLKGLTALRDAIDLTIKNKAVLNKNLRKIDVATSDGEGYEFFIALNQDNWQSDFWQNKSAPHYLSSTVGLQLDTVKDNIIKECRRKHNLVEAYSYKNDVIRVGDRVQFKEWDEMVKEYGTSSGNIKCESGFASKMRHLCGACATVTKVDSFYGEISDTKIILNLKDFSIESSDTDYFYSTDMVRKVSPAEWDVR